MMHAWNFDSVNKDNNLITKMVMVVTLNISEYQCIYPTIEFIHSLILTLRFSLKKIRLFLKDIQRTCLSRIVI